MKNFLLSSLLLLIFVTELKSQVKDEENTVYHRFVYFVMIKGMKTGYCISDEFVAQGGRWNNIAALFDLEAVTVKIKLELKQKYGNDWKLDYLFLHSTSAVLAHGYFIFRFSYGLDNVYDVAVNRSGNIFPIGKSFDLFDGLTDFTVEDDVVPGSFSTLMSARTIIQQKRLDATEWKIGGSIPNTEKIGTLIFEKLKKGHGSSWNMRDMLLIDVDGKNNWLLVFNCDNNERDKSFTVYSDFVGAKQIFEKTR